MPLWWSRFAFWADLPFVEEVRQRAKIGVSHNNYHIVSLNELFVT